MSAPNPTPEPLSIDDANELHARYHRRREMWPDEPEHTSFMVTVFNFGDHLTAVSCIGGEWTGRKVDLQPRDGVPLCPAGHPLMEHGPRHQLALVEVSDG